MTTIDETRPDANKRQAYQKLRPELGGLPVRLSHKSGPMRKKGPPKGGYHSGVEKKGLIRVPALPILLMLLVMLIPSVTLAESQAVKAVEARLQQYEARFNDQDPESIARLFAEDVVYYDALGRVHKGRDAVEDLYRQNFRAGFGEITIETIEVQVINNTAYDIARYTVVSPAGEPLVGYHLAILSRKSGEWVVQRTLVNAVMPEPPDE